MNTPDNIPKNIIMNDKELFSLSLDIGEEIIRCGGEIGRAKETIRRINSENDDCVIFALPNFLFAKCGNMISARRIGDTRLDMAEIERLNALSRRICEGKYNDINITKQVRLYKTADMLFNSIAVFCFCVFFGGSFYDALFSAAIGMIISSGFYRRRDYSLFTANLIDSFIIGTTACIFQKFLPTLNTDKIIIGAIMILVPGITIQNAARDMVNGDIEAGGYELLESIMSALAIAVSIATAILLGRII